MTDFVKELLSNTPNMMHTRMFRGPVELWPLSLSLWCRGRKPSKETGSDELPGFCHLKSCRICQTKPEYHHISLHQIVKLAVYGMLPRNLHRRTMMQRLHIFPEDVSQEPSYLSQPVILLVIFITTQAGMKDLKRFLFSCLYIDSMTLWCRSDRVCWTH